MERPEYMMGREGFEPSKAKPTDLQSAPFDRSGTSPLREIEGTKKQFFCQVLQKRATCQIRTDDPEITSHVLWPAELRWH